MVEVERQLSIIPTPGHRAVGTEDVAVAAVIADAAVETACGFLNENRIV